MPDEPQVTTSRKQVAIRLLYTLLYVAIFELVKTIVLLITLFEYFYPVASRCSTTSPPGPSPTRWPLTGTG